MALSWEACVHEAAHTLWMLESRAMPIRMVVTGDGGHVDACIDELSEGERQVLGMVGAAAEGLLTDNVHATPSESDERIYHSAGGDDPNNPRMRRHVWLAAERFVLENERGIKALAASLSHRGTMTATDIAEVVHKDALLFRFRKRVAKPQPKPVETTAPRSTRREPFMVAMGSCRNTVMAAKAKALHKQVLEDAWDSGRIPRGSRFGVKK